MTGAPIYLVSACSSGEEFVAAFRRYADRNGVVFVPIADPLPSGRKGRFALTLKDGGVMVEGDAEVVSSARTPSVLYGRVGMTLKFLVPDEPSKTTLGELEKARLALKPSPPTIAPRPADVPAEPRPKPPVPTGRIDSVNALAECVAIGAGIPPPGEGGEAPPKNTSQKFVVPSVPSLPPGRPRTPSTPGTPAPKPGGTVPPAFKPLEAKPPATPTTMGIAPLAKPPTAPDPTAPSPARLAVAAAREKVDLNQTMRGPAPGVDLTASGKVDLSMTMRGTKPAAAATTPRNPPPASTPPPTPPPRQPTPSSPLPVAKPMRMATPFAPMPVVQQPARPAPPVVAPPPKPAPEVEVSEPTDLTGIPQVHDEIMDPLSDSTIPIEVPHDGSAPVMIVAGKPQEDPPKDDKPERVVREPRRTVMGVAVVPSGVMVLPAAPAHRIANEEESRDTSVMESQSPTGSISAPRDAVDEVDALSATLPPQVPLRGSAVQATVEEPTPSGDWTMTPGIDGPTITPTPRGDKGEMGRAPTVPAVPRGPQTGDWMIALDPSQPDGWSEPSKVEKRPAGELPPGPPVSVVSSTRALDSNARHKADQEWAPEPTVQVDPTLIGPLKQMPSLDGDDDDAIEQPLPPPPSVQRPVVGEDGLMPIPTSFPPTPMAGHSGHAMHEAPAMSGPMARQMPGPMPGSYVTPPAGQPQLASASGANPAYNTQAPFAPARGVTDDGSGFFRDSGDIPSYATGPTPAIDDGKRRKRLIVIIASAVAAVVLGIILVLALGGGSKASSTTPEPAPDTIEKTPDTPDKPVKATTPVKPDTAVKATTPDKPSVAITKVDAGSETPATVDAATAAVAVKVAPDAAVADVTPTDCSVAVASVPAGAEVVVGKNVVGTTPATLTLPCGVEARFVVRKARFVSQTREVTPKVGSKPIRIALAKVTFSVKVSSTPPGASIFVGAKSMGFTPGMVKLPAFELSTLKIAKDGFTPDMQKITPKQNNQTVHSTLKKLPKKLR